VKLADPGVEAEGVASDEEVAAAPQKKKLVVVPWLAFQLALRRLAHRRLSGRRSDRRCFVRCSSPRFEIFISIHLHSTAIESPEKELESPPLSLVERSQYHQWFSLTELAL
jgi:hypothetical protein